MGILGALLGTAVGIASIILFSRLGFVAVLSGFILILGSGYGYLKLGKDMSVFGVVVCLVLSLAAPYIAEQLDWALLIVEEFGISLFDAFFSIGDFLEYGIIDQEMYTDSMVQTYIYCLLGIGIMGFNFFKTFIRK